MQKGQSLLEIIIGIAVGWLLIASATVVLTTTLRTGKDNVSLQAASALAKDLLEKAVIYSEYKWYCADTPNCGIYNLSKGVNNHYYITLPPPFKTVSGNETNIMLNNQTFTRYFYVLNVCRDASGNIGSTFAYPQTCPGGQIEDTNTQKIVSVASWGIGTISLESIVTRKKDFVLRQTDWSGGGAGQGPFPSNPVFSIFFEPQSFHTSDEFVDFTTIVGSLFPNSPGNVGSLLSVTFDTCLSGINCGIVPYTIMWRGDAAGLPGNPGDYVKFQIATECINANQIEPNCSGGEGDQGWNFIGPGGNPSSYYENILGPGVPIKINTSNHFNNRYLKYKVFIYPCPSCSGQSEGEGGGEEDGGGGSIEGVQVDDIIIHWSP